MTAGQVSNIEGKIRALVALWPFSFTIYDFFRVIHGYFSVSFVPFAVSYFKSGPDLSTPLRSAQDDKKGGYAPTSRIEYPPISQ